MGVVDAPLKLLYNFGAVLVGNGLCADPFMILAIYNSVEKMDWSIVEAARDLGPPSGRPFDGHRAPDHARRHGGVRAGVRAVGGAVLPLSDLLGGAKTMLLGNLIKNVLPRRGIGPLARR